MKSLVIYFSHRGNTAFVSRAFYDALKKRGEAYLFELKYVGEKSLLVHLFYRFFPSRAQLATVPTDLQDYDVLCLGIPVLGGYPSSAITKYVQMISSLSGKKVICCHVYGIEASADHCSRYMEKILSRAGKPTIIEAYVPWYDVLREHFMDNIIDKSLSQLTSGPTIFQV